MDHHRKGYSRLVSIKEDTAAAPAKGRKIILRIPSIKQAMATLANSDDIDSDSELLRDPFCIFAIFLLIALCVASLVWAFTVADSLLQDLDLVESHLPAFRILRLDVGEIRLVAAADVGAAVAVTADLAVSLEAANGKETTELLYRFMSASVAASGFQFGRVRLADVRQPPENSTTLVVAAAVKDKVVDCWMASDLRKRAEAHVLMIDVSLNGWIDMKVGGEKMMRYMFGVECRSINQSVIDAGRAPNCSIVFDYAQLISTI